jgi:hypothetical protein
MEASEQTTPEAPEPQTTDDLLRAVLAEQQQHRQEVAHLREELAAAKQPVVQQAPSVALSAEDALAARMSHIGQHPFYCPGCGLTYDYQQRCTGKAESPHPPIEVVSTDELKEGDPSKHTKMEYVKA